MMKLVKDALIDIYFDEEGSSFCCCYPTDSHKPIGLMSS